MRALILAGGFATRLWPLTEKKAKPLIPLAGKPIISYLIEKIPQNIPVTISTNAVFQEDFQIWKKTNFPDRNIEIFIEDSAFEGEKKGALAATALFLEEKNIQEDLFLLAGDNYFGLDFESFFQKFTENPLLAAYDIKEKEEAKKFGVIVPKEGFLVKEFEEKPKDPSSTLVSTGAYIFPKQNITDIKTYSKTHADDLGGIFEYFLQKGISVEYFSFSERWYDIGSFSAFLAANKDLMGEKCQIGKNVIIGENCIFSESVYIEDNTVIDNVSLENVIILKGCTLRNTEIRNSVIGENVTIDGLDLYGKIIRDETFLVV